MRRDGHGEVRGCGGGGKGRCYVVSYMMSSLRDVGILLLVCFDTESTNRAFFLFLFINLWLLYKQYGGFDTESTNRAFFLFLFIDLWLLYKQYRVGVFFIFVYWNRAFFLFLFIDLWLLYKQYGVGVFFIFVYWNLGFCLLEQNML